MAVIDTNRSGTIDLYGSAILERSRPALYRNTGDARGISRSSLKTQQWAPRSVVVDNDRLISTTRACARTLQCNHFGHSDASSPRKRPGRKSDRVAVLRQVMQSLDARR